jgi:D-serine deaminase-like pyridoxal phosphate-dependent protein
VKLGDLQTPALCADLGALDENLRSMAEALPGAPTRPHVKAHKCTSLARRQAELGHRSFTCATIREMEGMGAAGLGEDLLLANEVLDASGLGALVAGGTCTYAVDGWGAEVQAGGWWTSTWACRVAAARRSAPAHWPRPRAARGSRCAG